MSPVSKRFEVRTMRREELPVMIDWAAQEGWNPGQYDAAPFWAADSGGFWVGLLEGMPVATISAVRYGAGFGFIGFYLVRPEYRGQGFGQAIWQAAMEHLHGRTIGLDGVLAQQENYWKSGFVLAHRNIRFEGRGESKKSCSPATTVDLVRLNEMPGHQWLDYDQAFFPARRDDFLRAWIDQPGSIALGACEASRLTGYAVLRPCRTGFKIGPLFADSPAVAGTLLAGLLKELPPDSPYFLDVPACNPAAVALAEQARMRMVFETARMYYGAAPALALERTYGITSFELG